MESRIDAASKLQARRYNCAQSVACAYADLVGADIDTVYRMCEGFGLGLGCMEGSCGALVGACAVAGLRLSDANRDEPRSKAATNRVTGQMTRMFRERVGSTTCATIKGQTGGPLLMSCQDCVRTGAAIVEEVLFAEE